MNYKLDQEINHLATVVSDGFKSVDQRLGQTNKRIDDLADDLAERFTKQDEQTRFQFDGVNNRLDSIVDDLRVIKTSLEKTLPNHSKRIERLESVAKLPALEESE